MLNAHCSRASRQVSQCDRNKAVTQGKYNKSTNCEDLLGPRGIAISGQVKTDMRDTSQ